MSDPWAPGEDDYEPGNGYRPTDLSAMVRSLREVWDGADQRPGTLEHLIYRGKTHSLWGPPSAGKTIIAMHFAIAAMRTGGDVIHWDEEIGRQAAAGLYQALGAEPELLDKHLIYLQTPGLAMNSPAHRAGLAELVTNRSRDVKLAVFDSSAAMLGAANVNENDNGAVTRFWQQVWMPLAIEYGTAVIVIDHGGRSESAANSRGGRGAEAKLASADVTMRLTPIVPFSRAQDGWLQLTVTKDRPGWLRPHWQVRVTHSPLRLAISPAKVGDLSPAARRILEVLSLEEWMAHTEIGDAIADRSSDGIVPRRETMSRALNRLAAAGLVDRLEHSGRSLWKRTGRTLADVESQERAVPPEPDSGGGWPEGSEGAAVNGG